MDSTVVSALIALLGTIIGALPSYISLKQNRNLDEKLRNEPKDLIACAQEIRLINKKSSKVLSQQSVATSLWNAYALEGWTSAKITFTFLLTLLPLFVAFCFVFGTSNLMQINADETAKAAGIFEWARSCGQLFLITCIPAIAVSFVWNDRRKGQINIFRSLIFGTKHNSTFYEWLCNKFRCYGNRKVREFNSFLEVQEASKTQES